MRLCLANATRPRSVRLSIIQGQFFLPCHARVRVNGRNHLLQPQMHQNVFHCFDKCYIASPVEDTAINIHIFISWEAQILFGLQFTTSRLRQGSVDMQITCSSNRDIFIMTFHWFAHNRLHIMSRYTFYASGASRNDIFQSYHMRFSSVIKLLLHTLFIDITPSYTSSVSYFVPNFNSVRELIYRRHQLLVTNSDTFRTSVLMMALNKNSPFVTASRSAEDDRDSIQLSSV